MTLHTLNAINRSVAKLPKVSLEWRQSIGGPTTKDYEKSNICKITARVRGGVAVGPSGWHNITHTVVSDGDENRFLHHVETALWMMLAMFDAGQRDRSEAIARLVNNN